MEEQLQTIKTTDESLRSGFSMRPFKVSGEPARPFSGRYWHLWILGFIVAGGLFVRAHNLGINSFWIDELFHVEAAKSILETGEPLMPGGRTYKRAASFSSMVARSFSLFGVDETAARIPAVFFGILTVILAFYVMQKWFGLVTGLTAAFLLAFAPAFIYWSRECRMYTYFQFLYLLLAYLIYEFLETRSLSRFRKVLLGASVMLAGYLSLQTHNLTVFMIPSLAFYCFAVAMLPAQHSRPWYVPSSKYAALFFLGLAGAAGAAFLSPGALQQFFVMVQQTPPWSRAHNHPLYYKWWLEDIYPFFLYAYPLATGYLCLNHYKKGMYLFSLFVVPFLLMSALFARKEERYLLFALTFFLLGLAPLLAAFLQWGLREIQNFWSRASIPVLIRILSFPFCLAAFYPLLLHPWTVTALQIPLTESHLSWREFSGRLSEKLNPGDVILTGVPLELFHYLPGRGMFVLNNYFLLDYASENDDLETRYRDSNTGFPLITRQEEFESLLRTHADRTLWFVFNAINFDDPHSIPFAIRDYLIDRGEWFNERMAPIVFSPAEGKDKNRIIVCRLNPRSNPGREQ